jgi:hypothetical protein
MPQPLQERRQERLLRLFVRGPQLVRLQVLPQVLLRVPEPVRLRGPLLFQLPVPEPVRLRVLPQVPLRGPVQRQVPQPVRLRGPPLFQLPVPEPARLRVLPQVRLRGPEPVPRRGPVQRPERELAQLGREPQPAPTARRLRAFQPAWEHRPFSHLHRTQQA